MMFAFNILLWSRNKEEEEDDEFKRFATVGSSVAANRLLSGKALSWSSLLASCVLWCIMIFKCVII